MLERVESEANVPKLFFKARAEWIIHMIINIC